MIPRPNFCKPHTKAGAPPLPVGAAVPSGRLPLPRSGAPAPSPQLSPKRRLLSLMWSIDRIEGEYALCENTVTG